MEYKYKKPILRLVDEIAFEIDPKRKELAGKILDDEGKEFKLSPMGELYEILFKKEKRTEYAPTWKRFCELALESPDGFSDIHLLTAQEAIDIQEGFTYAADPLMRPLAALRSSEASEPKVN